MKENSKKYLTLETLKKLDEHIWLLDYKDNYSLENILDSGKKSILGLSKLLQKEICESIKLDESGDGFACSTFNVKTKENHYLLARNFDYKDSPCLVLWTHPENGYSSISVADLNLMLYGYKYNKLEDSKNQLRLMAAPYTCMDGINEKGLAFSILEIKAKQTKQTTGRTPILPVIALRAVLDECKNIEEAVGLMEAYDMNDLLGANYHYQLLDATGKSVIIEYVNNEMRVIEQKENDEKLKLTNFFLSKDGDNSKARGRNRYQRIERTINKNETMSHKEAMELLARCVMKYHHPRLPHMVITAWSNVYDCTDKSMLLCAGLDYTKMYKFSVNEPLKFEVIQKTGIKMKILNEDMVDKEDDVVDESKALITVKSVHKSYGTESNEVHALNNVSFKIYPKEILVILGSSGSGKSTLLNLIGGMDKASSGKILYNGEDICTYGEKERTNYRKKNIGFVFQSFNLINEITVQENVAITSNKEENPNIVDEVIAKVGLENKKDKYPSQLSGGEQQRVSIARALAKNTDILLCDEPTGALDYKTGKQILVELEKLSKEQGKTVIIVTHTREIGKMADRIITLKNGEVTEERKNDFRIKAENIEW